MVAAVYTRHRTSGPVVKYASAAVADLSVMSTTLVELNESRSYLELSPGGPYEVTASIEVLRYSPGWPQHVVYDTVIGETYTNTIVTPSFSSITNVSAIVKSEFMAILQDKMKKVSIDPETTAFLESYESSEIHDTPTHNFKKRFAKGEVINNSVLNRKTTFSVEREVVAALEKKYAIEVRPGYQLTQFLLVPLINADFIDLRPPSVEEVEAIRLDHFGVSHSSFFNAKDTAINAAFGKVNKGAYGYLEELGEAKETVLYIASVFTRIASMFKAVRRGKLVGIVPKTHKRAVKRAKKRSKANGTSYQLEYGLAVTDFLTSAWMELRFAIRPLLLSAEDAIEIYQDGIKEHSGRSVQNYRAQAVGTDVSTSEEIGPLYRTVTHREVETQRTATAGVLIEISTAIAKMRTLGFTNLAGTLWELTFLSWAADYFGNLDGLLYHLTPDIGVNVLTAWSGTRDEIKVSTRVVRYAISDDRVLDMVEYSTTNLVYQRDPIDGPGYFTLDIDLDALKLADLGSLFYGMLRSTKTKGFIK